jgi:hypothetical protein
MELWQRQGFASFGDWRRASERARKAAKKKAGAGRVAAVAPLPSLRVAWQPFQPLKPLSPSRVTPPFKPSYNRVKIVHEHVAVTPSGSRAHAIEHTSPGGTTRCDEYVSLGTHDEAIARNKWRQHVMAVRREERIRRQECATREIREAREERERLGITDFRRSKLCWRTCSTCATSFEGRRLFCCDACVIPCDDTAQVEVFQV